MVPCWSWNRRICKHFTNWTCTACDCCHGSHGNCWHLPPSWQRAAAFPCPSAGLFLQVPQLLAGPGVLSKMNRCASFPASQLSEVGSFRQRFMGFPVCPCGPQATLLEFFHIHAFLLPWLIFLLTLGSMPVGTTAEFRICLTASWKHEQPHLCNRYCIPHSHWCYCVYSPTHQMPSDSRWKSTSVQGTGLELVTNQMIGWWKMELLRFDEIKSQKYSYKARKWAHTMISSPSKEVKAMSEKPRTLN